MFLEPGTIAPGNRLYRGQGTVQVVLLLMAAVCVPWLLIAKPYLLWKETHKVQGQGYVGIGHDEPNRHSTDDALEGEEEGNGRAIAEDAGEGHVNEFCHSLLLLVANNAINYEGTARLQRGCDSSNHSYDRVLSWMYITYRVVPPSLGLVSCACPIVGSLMVHDDRGIPGTDHPLQLGSIAIYGNVLVWRYCWHSLYYGGACFRL